MILINSQAFHAVYDHGSTPVMAIRSMRDLGDGLVLSGAADEERLSDNKDDGMWQLSL